MRQAFLVALLVGAGCTSDNPNYCEDDASCSDPSAPVCHPAKHYCHAACTSNEQCQDPASPAHEPGKPVCERASGHCVAQRDGGASDWRRDAAASDLAADLRPADGPKQKLGTPCTTGALCESGFCVDGYCCSGACSSTCVTCAAKGNEGTCVPAAPGQDPRKDCTGKHASCGGSCDGNGKCSFAAVLDKECAPPTCGAPGELTTSSCDPAGACVAQKKGCGGYACASGACKTSCSSTSDCAGTAQCVGSKCVDNLPLGSPCGTNKDACQSKLCTDGVCCTVASCGTCKACGTAGTCVPAGNGSVCGAPTCTGTAATGAQKTVHTCVNGSCTPATTSCGDFLCAGSDCLTTCASDAQCKATAYCDGNAKCTPKKPVGQACGAAKECQNGLCVDGYCCATACAGLCERCDLATKGQCLPIPNGQDPQGECPGQVAACKGSCNGNRACAFPVGTVCQGPSCTGSTLTSFACNATGACAGTPASCAPYTCAASGTACRTTCAANAECTTAYCDLIGFPDAARLNKCAAASDLCKPSPGTVTIQSCLDQLKYYVLPADGSYGENLTTKAQVQLVSTTSTGPLMVGGFPVSGVAKVLLRPAATGTPGLRISTPTAVHGLELTPNGGTGPLVYADATALIRTTWIHHGAGVGISRIPTGTYAIAKVDLVDVGINNCTEGIDVKDVDLSLDRVGIGFAGGHGLVQINRSLKLRDVVIAFNGAGTGLYTLNTALDIDRAKIGVNKKGLQLTSTTTGTIWNLLVNDNAEEGIVLTGNSTPKLYSVTIAGNGGIGLDCGTPGITIANAIVWGKTDTTSILNDCSFSYSNVRRASGPVGGTGNINQDPIFVGGAGSDPFALQASSPCIDVGGDSLGGVTYPTKDVIGNPRKVDRPGGGALIDMGAYEVQ